MANGVNIPIVVTANTAGAQQAAGALQGVANAGQQASQAVSPPAGNPWVTASRGLQQMQQGAKEAAPAVENVGKAAQKAAGNSKAQGLLLLGQALEDAQYGIRGVLNNIPGLVMSFGLGAGAAGALQIALVAISQVMNLLQSEADEGLDWSKMTPSEELEARIRAVTEQLREQAAALDDLSKARNRSIQADKSWLAHQEEMARLTKANEDPKKVNELFNEREKLRESEVKAAEESAQAYSDQAQMADEAAKAQEQKVEDLKKLPGLQQQEADQAKKVEEARSALATAEAGARGMLQPAVRSQMQQAIAEEQDRLNQIRTQIKQSPELEGVDADATPEEKKAALDREEQAAKDLRRQAEDAARKAADEKAKLDATRQETRQQSEQDAVRTTQQLEEMTGLTPLPNADTGRSPLLEPGIRPLLTPKADQPDEAAEAARIEAEIAAEKEAEAQRQAEQQQAQSAGNEAITQAVAGLDEMSAVAKNDQMRNAIAELRATLTDADGATAADVQRIQQFLGTLQNANSEAQKAIAGTLAAMAQAQQSFVGEINSLRAQVEQLRTSANSMR